MTDNKSLQEYDYLRAEIMQKMGLHNSLLTFTITTVVAVLAIGAAAKAFLLYLVPFFIIIPMSLRIAYYRSAMAKISAYMIVFLEEDLKDMHWESRNSELMHSLLVKDKRQKRNIRLVSLHYNECLVLSFACCLLYYFSFPYTCYSLIITIIALLIPLLLFIAELIITIRFNEVDKERQAWINLWTIYKNKLDN